MKTFIKVHTSFEGWHCWKGAPIEVGFLKNLHRHVFHIELKVNVNHKDRALEFFIVQHFLNDVIKKKWPDGQLGSMSCEMVAQEIFDAFCVQYGHKKGGLSVYVSEDNENGGGVEI